MMKRVTRPTKAVAAIVLASQIVSMLTTLDDCEGLDLGVTGLVADRPPPVGSKNAKIKARAASRNQTIHLITKERMLFVTD
jgi:hypothetical protein